MTTNPNQDQQPGRLDETTAKGVLLAGAVVGIILVGVGVYLTVTSWSAVVGGVEEWHKNWWRLLLCELAIFGGLGVMFGALHVARSEERTNPGLRRLLYGYNAFLTSLLLLTILGHINVLAYLPFRPFNSLNAAYDWTEATLYTLSPESTAFLQKLDKPVKVYVLIPANNEFLYREISTLMDNVRRVNSKIEVKSISPDLSNAEVSALAEKYQIPEREGMLVVYGTEGEEKYDFIKPDELFSVKRADFRKPDEKPRVEFTGESALIGKLSYLVEGKARPTVYFTQGNGELDLENSDAQRDDQGLGRLRDRLGRANYEVKDLKLGFGETKVPDDAALVVIARPSNRLPAPALDALREYMKPGDPKKKKGKMIILFDVVKGTEGGMAQTGLEDFVKEFGVQVDNDRVIFLGAPTGNPLDVLVTANPRSENPVVSHYQGKGFILRDVRTVDAAQRNPAADYQAEALLLAPAQYGVWKETNLDADVTALVKSLAKPGREEDLQRRLSRENLPVAVSVTELGAPANPSDPHGFMNREQKPRMLVFGDATWVSNRRMGEAGQFELFSGSLAWLRDRPDVAAATQAKERKPYIISSTTPGTLWWHMALLPITLISLGIVGLGAGVWVVRRR
jgi:hypothetical protein